MKNKNQILVGVGILAVMLYIYRDKIFKKKVAAQNSSSNIGGFVNNSTKAINNENSKINNTNSILNRKILPVEMPRVDGDNPFKWTKEEKEKAKKELDDLIRKISLRK